VFNGELYLAEALDSIFVQTYRPLEVIVVDDGSTDATAKVAARYGECITYIWQTNAGPAAARNRGIDAAAGPFIAFLDADDLWHEEKLARQMARFEVQTELEMCLSYVQNFWPPEYREEKERLGNHRFVQPMRAYSLVAMLVRRDVFDAVGPFDPSLRMGEDNDWFMRAVEARTVIEHIPDVLSYRRMHESNMSRDRALMFDLLPRIIKASLNRRRGNVAGKGVSPARSRDPEQKS
jgi:glycosyltransferase involved in cell wall biosynthesis